MKKLVQEDECAPDAREYFETALTQETGLTLLQFQVVGKYTSSDDGYTMQWTVGRYFLQISSDFPWYTLYDLREDVK